MPSIIENAVIPLPHLIQGQYQIEWWNTYTGDILKRETLEQPAATTFNLRVPAFDRDLACKITRLAR
jgi:hypothetical protein